MPRCNECAKTSLDPEWCDHCGAELREHCAPTIATGHDLVIDGSRVSLIRRRCLGTAGFSSWDVARDDGTMMRLEILPRRRGTSPAARPPQHVLCDNTPFFPIDDASCGALVEVDAPLLLAEWVAGLHHPRTVDDVLPVWRRLIKCVARLHEDRHAVLEIAPWVVRLGRDAVTLVASPDVGVWAVPWGTRLGRDINLSTSPFASPSSRRSAIIEADHVVSPNDDRQSLGLLLFAMATGRLPPMDPRDGALHPQLPPRSLAPDMGVGFAPLIRRALRVEPTDADVAVSDAPNGTFVGDLGESAVRILSHRTRSDATATPTLRVAWSSHPGVARGQQGTTNQDRAFARLDTKAKVAIVAVFDGISTATYGNGEIAAQIALDVVNERTRDLPRMCPRGSDDRSFLRDVLEAANRSIVEHANREFAPFRCDPAEIMGSTATLALVRSHTLCVASIGDSPAILIRDGFTERLNRDHTTAVLAVCAGSDPATAMESVEAFALSRCLGNFVVTNDGALSPIALDCDIFSTPVRSGDRIVLCTDGLTGYVGDSEDEALDAIERIVSNERCPDRAAGRLIRNANAGGGGDNITAALVYVDAPGARLR